MALNQHHLKNLSNSKCFQTDIVRNHLEVNIEKSEYHVLVLLCKPIHDIHFLQYLLLNDSAHIIVQ